MRPPILLLLASLTTASAGFPLSSDPAFAPPARQQLAHGPQSHTAPRSPVGFPGHPTSIAPGVDLFRVDDAMFGVPQAPQSIRLLRLDPRRVRLASALATADLPGRAAVLDIARRTGALAAVNAGFFSPPGEPVGLLKVGGRLVSDTRRARGAVALLDDGRAVGLRFGRATARVSLRFRVGDRAHTVRVDGVDTERTTGRLVLYTPASGATTGTAGGREWTIRPTDGSPSRLRASRPTSEGNSAIPPDGFVLSRGGSVIPAALARLPRAADVSLQESIEVQDRRHLADWRRAPAIVGGAGLLIASGRPVTEWSTERLSNGFATTRHPRTVIARDRAGAVWLVTVDGRQPGATGMTFAELQWLLARLDATDALNLDGGGSTTLVVSGKVVNRPSDLTGPRPVSDAIVVSAR